MYIKGTSGSWSGPLREVTGLFGRICEGQGLADSILVGWVFLRLIAVIYFAAFASLAAQIAGLVGSEGILPAREYLDQAEKALGYKAFLQIPTVFWFDASDSMLELACLAGMAASSLALVNRFTRPGLVVCYVLYLSLVDVGQDFTSFQWDMFLLESGFLALFLTSGSPVVVWLFRFLLFRFMFMGGVVKLASGDQSWRDLTALNFHFETQPLPSPLAWYVHQLPESILKFATAGVFFIELVVPFWMFFSRPYRLLAAASFILLQGSIMLTGNFNFFNLLTFALCVFLLQDCDLRRLLGARLSNRILAHAKVPGALSHVGAGMMAVFTLLVCGGLLWWTNTQSRPMEPLGGLVRFATTFSLVNGYGPFAVMTSERREIIVEGSSDGQTWLPYEFKFKPGELTRPLGWNIPHQPRLDWQMWFAALGEAEGSRWFMNFMEKLRQGSDPVLSLLKYNPFPDHPPSSLRARFFRYRFSTPEQKASNGQVWQREPLGDYLPAF